MVTEQESEDDWSLEFANARKRILSTVPECLSQFKVRRITNPSDHSDDEPGELITSFEIACQCNERRGRLLGYSLREFNTKFKGKLQFVRPIHFGCSGCYQSSLMIDEHGYHSEVAKLEGGIGSATFRGSGETQPFHCHECGREQFTVVVTFIYSDGAFDLFLDEPELPAANFFDVFEARGKCSECSKTSLIASFEG